MDSKSRFGPHHAGEPEQLAGGRSFGGAIQAVLRYLSGAAALQQRVPKGAATAPTDAAAALGTTASIAGSYAGQKCAALLSVSQV